MTLEFKVALDSNGNTWNTEGFYFDFPAVLDRRCEIPFSVRSSAYPQNYIYSIERVDRSQEGLYTVTALSMNTYYIDGINTYNASLTVQYGDYISLKQVVMTNSKLHKFLPYISMLHVSI